MCRSAFLKQESKMSVFNSSNSYSSFQWDVVRRNRYTRGAESRDFLTTLFQTSISRKKLIDENSILWRAQLGHRWESIDHDGQKINAYERPFPEGRMTPLRDSAREGRANPKGIPYLYTATNRETAMAEVRPWIGSFISVAQFITIKELRIVDLSADGNSRPIYLDEPGPIEREKAIWVDINRAFSKPVTPTDETAEYAPTQIIAEMFKSEGYDGIAYRSALADGHNIALFEIESTRFVSCHLFKVFSINFEFQIQCESSIFIPGSIVNL